MPEGGGRFADAVILAAGRSERMGGQDKLLMPFGRLPLIGWTLEAICRAQSIVNKILVVQPERVEQFENSPWLQSMNVVVVPGGYRRQDSVAAGVRAATSDVVVIHDGARPLVTPNLVDRVTQAAAVTGAAMPVVSVAESLRRLAGGRIVCEIDRTHLYRSQTPHGVRRQVLLSVYKQSDPHGPHDFIDELVAVRLAGYEVATVPGEPVNLKVTAPGDAELVCALLAARSLDE